MVAYHMYWPSSADPFYQANPTQNTERKTYYGVNATPTLKVDGVLDIWPISVASVTDAINQRLAVTSHIWLDMSAVQNGIYLNATAKAVADINITGNKVIQMELLNRYSYIPNSPNGNPNFYAAMRLMAPTSSGQAFSANAGDTVTYSCSFRLNAAWDVDSLDIVCFVQDNDAREVLQAHMEPATPQTAQNVDIALTPINPPIQIPASGGTFHFGITLTNNMDSTAHFYAWIMQQQPNGVWQGPMLGPVWLSLPASATILRQRGQNVPSSALPGIYTYRGYVGMYNADARWDSSSFTYTKLTTGDGPWVSGWANTGQSFDNWSGETPTAAAPEGFAFHGAYPNPFNPQTVLSYQLPVASRVTLEVFDLAGRMVAELVNGMREAGVHQVTWEASGLPSGLYFCRIQAGSFTDVQKLMLIK